MKRKIVICICVLALIFSLVQSHPVIAEPEKNVSYPDKNNSDRKLFQKANQLYFEHESLMKIYGDMSEILNSENNIYDKYWMLRILESLIRINTASYYIGELIEMMNYCKSKNKVNSYEMLKKHFKYAEEITLTNYKMIVDIYVNDRISNMSAINLLPKMETPILAKIRIYKEGLDILDSR